MSTLEVLQTSEKPTLDPYPLSPYVAWAGSRNRDPILEVFKQKFPTVAGQVLEVASGSGMHIHHFAPHFQSLTFQPSDLNEEVFEPIQQLTQVTQVKNVQPPVQLDLTQPQSWAGLSQSKFDVIFGINIFQVAPLSIADGLAQLAAEYLAIDGALYLYGPFKLNGQYTTPSNEEFDKILLSYKVSEWGLKDVADITKAFEQHGLRLKEKVDMPSNNFILVYGF
jgi:hypothetical protein